MDPSEAWRASAKTSRRSPSRPWSRRSTKPCGKAPGSCLPLLRRGRPKRVCSARTRAFGPNGNKQKKTWTNVTMTNSPPKNQDSADQAGPIHVRTAWHAWHAAKNQAGVGVWGEKLRHCPMRQHVRPHPLNRPPAARDGDVCRGGEPSGTAAVTCFTVFFTSCNSPFGGRLLTLRMCGTMHGACACCTRTKKGSFSS